jgi:CheY-like chemotaxis protein
MCHVLIIEDEAIISLQIQLMLASAGATSFSFAASQSEAVLEAEKMRPGIITADVKLAEGTGPGAVAEISRRMGLIPTIFITGTPEDCTPCDPPHRIHKKPMLELEIIESFRAMAPI